MVNAWWREQITLYDNRYQPNPKRTEHLQKQIQLIGILFGSFRNRSTKHFMKYVQKFHTYIKEQKLPFELIYVPLDEDETDCEFFVKSVMGDWLFIPWDNQALRRNVRNMYNIIDQPWLIVVKNDVKGHLLSFNGKSDLQDYGYLCYKEWETTAKNVDPLS